MELLGLVGEALDLYRNGQLEELQRREPAVAASLDALDSETRAPSRVVQNLLFGLCYAALFEEGGGRESMQMAEAVERFKRAQTNASAFVTGNDLRRLGALAGLNGSIASLMLADVTLGREHANSAQVLHQVQIRGIFARNAALTLQLLPTAELDVRWSCIGLAVAAFAQMAARKIDETAALVGEFEAIYSGLDTPDALITTLRDRLGNPQDGTLPDMLSVAMMYQCTDLGTTPA